MRRLITVLIMMIVLSMPTSSVQANSNNETSLSILDRMADEALQLAKLERYNDTKALLENFDRLLAENPNWQYLIAMDDLRILEMSFQEAIGILEKDSINKEEIFNSVMKFRLVMDAIITDYQPLWTEMENSVMTAFQSVRDAVRENDKVSFHSNLNSFLSLYNVIYPSVLLDRDFEQLQRVDIQIQYISQYSDKLLSTEDGMADIEALATDLQTLFDESEEDEADPSLWWVIISTGGIIIATLSYVGFKKYKGEQQAKRDYEKERKN